MKSISYACNVEIHGYPPLYQASSLSSRPPTILPLPALFVRGDVTFVRTVDVWR